ncbi:MAG: ATP-binding protein [Candidatus Micrarchaeaceae archaeon]
MTKILDILVERNEWWKGEFKLEFKERTIYEKIRKFLGMRQMLSFTGIRRVGKTTLLMKIIEDSIASGLDPRNIVYFPFDEAKEIALRDLIKEYEVFSGRSLKDGKHLLVLDEVQKLNDWENQVKAVYDAYAGTTKILLSGSESLFIRKKSKESLAGRIFEFKINPLSFEEFLRFKGKDFSNVQLYEKELRRLLNEFIHTQGFPELVGYDDLAIIRKYIYEGIVEKVLYKDIPEIFHVSNIDALRAIIDSLMQEPGQIIEYTKLSKELGISRQSASDYTSYLCDSFLLRRLYNYSKSARKQERKLKKYYPTVIAPELTFKNDDLYRSRVFEWLIVNAFDAKFFWRDVYKHEVDIVTPDGSPIEIKYGNIDISNVLFFLDEFDLKRGYVVSWQKDYEISDKGKNVMIVSALNALLNRKLLPAGDQI